MKKIYLLLMLVFILVSCQSGPKQPLSIEVEVGTELTAEHLELETKEAEFIGYNPYRLGTQEVKVQQKGKSFIDLVVTVVDTTGPIITKKSEGPITVNKGDPIDLSLYVSVSDNSGETILFDPASLDTSQVGEFSVPITATDSSGNESKLVITLIVSEAIELILKQEAPMIVTVDNDFSLSEYFSVNMMGAEMSIEGSYDINKVGVYPITVTASYQDVTTSLKTTLEVVSSVTDPNPGGYSIIEPATLRNDRYILVNKRYQLPSWYEPENLVSVSLDDRILDQTITGETLKAYLELREAGLAAGVNPLFRSGYRSYELQESVYNGYLRTDPRLVVDTYSARPGHSEHQLGTVIDFCEGRTACFGDFTGTATHQWMLENAHHYGFILRFPQDQEAITGYNYESWHYRYVGKEVAQHFVTTGLTYDEYYFQFQNKLVP